MPKIERSKRRSTQIDEEQAVMIEELPEYKRVKLAGTVRLLLDEALAARKGQKMSFSLSSLKENLVHQTDIELVNLIKLSAEIIQKRSIINSEKNV